MDPHLYRRHMATCKHTSRSVAKCECPVWCDGYIEGRRLNHSMGTTNWERARIRLDRELNSETVSGVSIQAASDTYLEDCRARGLTKSTRRSYRKTLDHLLDWCEREHYADLRALRLDPLTQFRSSRPLKSSTQRKELETLRSFFAFAVDRGWTEENWAKRLRSPREHRIATLPYAPGEITALLEACGRLGNRDHAASERARARARALVLLLLYSGLRISDAAKLERSKLDIKTGKLLLRALKTGQLVYVRLAREAVNALHELPNENPTYFFWSGRSKLSAVVGNLRCTIYRLGKLAGVKAHPHRFRDTFAVQLLQAGVEIRTVQILLGHTSVRTTEQHYAAFSSSQQRLLDEAVAKLVF